MMNLPPLPPGTTLVINSFNPSSQNNKKSVYLPGAVRHSFLQNPSWTFTLNKIKHQTEKKKKVDKKPQKSSHTTTTLVANPLPNLTLQIQLPAFYSVAAVLRCGHMSQLVGKWLCNPMEQLKKQSKLAYSSQQSKHSTLSIMPDDSIDALSYQNQQNEEIDLTDKTDLQNSLVRYKKNENGLTSLSVCLEDRNKNLQALELVFVDTLPLETSTVISISYQCGSFSISIQSISNLQFVSSTTYPVPVLVNCQFNQSMTIAVTQLPSSFASFQTTPHYSIEDSPFIAADNMTANNNISNVTEQDLSYDMLQQREDLIEFYSNPYLPVWTPEDIKASSQFVQYFEQDDFLDEYQEDDSEECDDSEDSEEEDLAHMALLSLVQDTLEYIKSNQGAYCDELNSLKDKLQNHYISCFK